MVKYPKAFAKLTLEQQEVWLIKTLQETYAIEDEVRRRLAEVRRGYRYEPTTDIDRPDLLELKTA